MQILPAYILHLSLEHYEMTFISHKRRKSELILEVAAEGGVAGGFEGLDVLIRQAVHDAAVQADFCRWAWCGA